MFIYTILYTASMIPGILLLKKKYHIRDIFLLSSGIFLTTALNNWSTTIGTIISFFLYFCSFLYSEQDSLEAFSKSALMFGNQLLSIYLSMNGAFSFLFEQTNMTFSLIIITIIDSFLFTVLCFFEAKIFSWLEKKSSSIFRLIWSAICFSLFAIYFLRFRLVEFTEDNSPSFFVIRVSIVILILFLLFILIFIFSQKVYQSKLETEKERFAFENERRYQLDLIKNAEETRKIKHDIKNILTGMELHMQAGDMPNLINYYQETVKPLANQLEGDQSRLGLLKQFADLPIQSLLIEKLGNPVEDRIKVLIDVPEKIVFTIEDVPVIQRGLGIILDNALEEVESLGAGEILLSCRSSDNGWELAVENSCRKDLPPIHQLKSRGFTTKESGSGIGLANLKEIFESERYLLSTYLKEGRFIQHIRVFDE